MTNIKKEELYKRAVTFVTERGHVPFYELKKHLAIGCWRVMELIQRMQEDGVIDKDRKVILRNESI